jgi:hypothetical protein
MEQIGQFGPGRIQTRRIFDIGQNLEPACVPAKITTRVRKRQSLSDSNRVQCFIQVFSSGVAKTDFRGGGEVIFWEDAGPPAPTLDKTLIEL